MTLLPACPAVQSRSEIRAVSPWVCRKWLFSPVPLMPSLTPCPTERLSNPPPFSHSAEAPRTPVVLLHWTGSTPTVFTPLSCRAHARVKKRSCCQTWGWTETLPDLWKVMAKVTHTEPQRGNTSVLGSLCGILCICPSEFTQQHTCTI